MADMAFQLSVSVRDVGIALAFYRLLGFRVVSEGTQPFRWAHVTDEQVLISLAEDGSGVTALTYFVADVETRTLLLTRAGYDVQLRNDGFLHALVRDPNGVAVWLIGTDPAHVYRPTGLPVSRCGRFGEFSLEADDLAATIAFWETLGFVVTYQHEIAPWVTMKDALTTIGIYQRGICPHPFRNPSVAYFEPDMADRIAVLKQSGLVFVEEMLAPDDTVREAIAEAPDGPLFFLFSG